MRIRKIETGARRSAEIGRSSAELSGQLAEQGEGAPGVGEAEDAYQAGAAREGEEKAAHLGDHLLGLGELELELRHTLLLPRGAREQGLRVG